MTPFTNCNINSGHISKKSLSFTNFNTTPAIFLKNPLSVSGLLYSTRTHKTGKGLNAKLLHKAKVSNYIIYIYFIVL